MVWFIIAIGMVNFALGFGLAVALEHSWTPPRLPDMALPSIFSRRMQMMDAPDDWVDILNDPRCNSLFEAGILYLQKDLVEFGGQMIAMDIRVQRCLASPDQNELEEIVKEFETSVGHWLERQHGLEENFVSCRGNLGRYEELGENLEQIIRDRTAQLESSSRYLRSWKCGEDVSTSGRELNRNLQGTFRCTHEIESHLDELRLAVLLMEGRIGKLDDEDTVDPLTSLTNRIGLEALYHQWCRADRRRKRPLSLAIVDFDDFSEVNNDFGTAVGDKIISAVGSTLIELLDSDESSVTPVRVSGHAFAVFAGDETLETTVDMIERVRQTIDATVFLSGDQRVKTTVSCAIVEIAGKETIQNCLERLHDVVVDARAIGRNCTFADEGAGPKPATRPALGVEARELQLDGSL